MTEGSEVKPSALSSGGGIRYRVSPFVPFEQLNELFAASWDAHAPRNFGRVLRRSLS